MNDAPKKAKKTKPSNEFRRLLKIAPYTAKERLRKAIHVCSGNLLAISCVIGYSAWSSAEVRRVIKSLDLDDELAEAKRRASTMLDGQRTKASRARLKAARKIVDEARREEDRQRLREEIAELTRG